MLRADLLRKLKKTPASENKLSRRKTMFEENKLRNCDNLSKSLLNVYDAGPDTYLNVRSSMNRDANIPHSTKKVPSISTRINLSESLMTAKLLNDESPASLVSSPDQSFASAKYILNTPDRNAIEKGKWIFYILLNV